MTHTLRFLAEVEDDAVEGFIWYENKSRGLGEEFLRGSMTPLTIFNGTPCYFGVFTATIAAA